MRTTKEILESTKKAAQQLKKASNEEINKALLSVAEALEKCENIEKIIVANKIDLQKAAGAFSDVMLDRLTLNESRIKAMAKGIREVTALPSPVGKTIEEYRRPNGLLIKKVSVPMGVMAIIYESRPNVTSDAAALALKSGSACILRAGKEAYNSSYEIVNVIKEALCHVGLPLNCVNLIEDTTRNSAIELMTANEYVDLLIPRGGKGLISSCVENATVPCIQTGTGICHIYVDKYADFKMALDIIENAKMSRPSVCNAAEVLLVNCEIANAFLPELKKRLIDDRIAKGQIPVIFKCPSELVNVLSGDEIDNDGYDKEYLDYVLAVKTVKDVEDAAEHIERHSTGHSEAIITKDANNAKIFTTLVDSAAVYVNSSTRFTDGGEFGFGCEIGISTQKLHARGPLGLRELVSYKYIIEGDGQIR